MNVGVIEPEPGYLQGLAQLLHRHGALLAFDEVKTGAVIAPGGATERLGVRPDVIALAKAIGGGVPIGAVGGTEEAMRVLADGTMEGGDLQRQSPVDGGGAGGPVRDPDAGCLRAPRGTRSVVRGRAP